MFASVTGTIAFSPRFTPVTLPTVIVVTFAPSTDTVPSTASTSISLKSKSQAVTIVTSTV